MALRLADPKVIPGPFRNQAEAAFNVVAAWFLLNQNYMEEIYARPRLTRQDIGALHLPSVSPSPSSVTPNFPSALDIQDDYFDGPAVARSEEHTSELQSLMRNS